MILSRFFQGVDQGSVPTQISDHLLTLDREGSFSKTTFFCEKLRLEENVQFFECEFPNLRLLELAFTSSAPYQPFDSCTFDFPLNLICETPITIEIPPTVQILSIEAVEVPVEFIQNGKTAMIDQTSWVVTENNRTVQVKYGTETSSLLDHYSLLFYTKEVEFKEDPGVIMEPMTLIAYSSGRRLGQIMVEITDHPFSLAVLESDGPFINFNGSIPAYWAMNAHPSALEIMKKIRGLSLLGGIGYEALTDLDLDLEFLEVGGEIGTRAFDRTSGRIDQLTVESLTSDSFKGSNLYFNFVHLNTVEPGVKIEARLISLAHSSQVHVVEDAKTLVIREKFDLPIDVSELSLTKIDFRTVTNPGPFIIQNFGHQNLTFIQPSMTYRPIYRIIRVSEGRKIYREVVRKIAQNYPEVKKIDQIEVTIDNEEINRKSSVEEDGLIKVKMKESGALIGRFAIHIDRSDRYLLYGLCGLTLTLSAVAALY